MGMQKRTVVCQSSDGATLPESSCDIFNRPPDTGICNNGACSKRRTWQVGPWAPVSHPSYPYYPYNYRNYRNGYNHSLRGRRAINRLMHMGQGLRKHKKMRVSRSGGRKKVKGVQMLNIKSL
ncbi:hypothetical protein DPMN_017488 [Dreissena polymorpha]|uniref:Uncharacterized protein n=1 Tax=Dreissena polymorpha TaxID=45954 RepID=A0A9D4S6F1_DREPO|nr:hypothetical protein DPMN_017488 [Dreissena polymorpha]